MKIKYLLLFLFFHFASYSLQADNNSRLLKDSIKRKNILIIGNTALYTTNYIGLYYLWYNNYNTTNFHFFDDSKEWMQLDKAGHLFSAYHLTNFQAKAFQWSGMDAKRSILLGSAISLVYISTIEVFDGFSSEWGASISDIGANIMGISLYSLQSLFFEEQYIRPKYSYNFNSYLGIRSELFGRSYVERFYKDYNGQTYWFVLNISKITRKQFIPKYLDLALGYGANNMTGGHENPIEFGNYSRERQYYLSLDVNLYEIDTKVKWINTLFKYINIIKFPMPTLEYSDQKITFHPIYF